MFHPTENTFPSAPDQTNASSPCAQDLNSFLPPSPPSSHTFPPTHLRTVTRPTLHAAGLLNSHTFVDDATAPYADILSRLLCSPSVYSGARLLYTSGSPEADGHDSIVLNLPVQGGKTAQALSDIRTAAISGLELDGGRTQVRTRTPLSGKTVAIRIKTVRTGSEISVRPRRGARHQEQAEEHGLSGVQMSAPQEGAMTAAESSDLDEPP